MATDFMSWMSRQGATESQTEEEGFWLRCSCGKDEYVYSSAYDNGDTGWYSDDIDSGRGKCGGQWCMP